MAKQSRFDLMVALKANAKDFKSGMGKAQKSLKGFVSQAAPAFGPLNSVAGRFLSTFTMGSQAIRGMIPAIKGVKAALVATGIGAILVVIGGALAGISAYLTKTSEGSDKLNVVWTKLKATGSVFFDRMIDGGKGVLKMFTDLKGGARDVANSFKGMFKEANKEQKLAGEIAKEENKLRKDKIGFIVTEARLNMEIADLIRKSKSLEYDRGKRVLFLNEAIKKQNQLSDMKVKITGKELNLQQRLMDMGHNSYDDLQKEAELKRDMLLIEKERDDKARELENRIREATNALNDQEKVLKKIMEDQIKITAGIKEAFQIEETDIPEVTEDLKELNKEMAKVTSTKITIPKEAFKGLKGVFTDMDNQIGLVMSGISGISYAFDTMARSGVGAMKGMVTGILASFEALIQGYIATAIAGMIAKEVSTKGLFGLITASIGIAGLMALWRNKVPSFAKGGIVTGETIATVGDYRNAKSNPEVISPLSDLKKYMGGGQVRGRLEADGTALVAVISSVNKRNKIMS